MTVFAVEYRYEESTAARRDEVRPDHRAWLSGLAEEGVLLASGPYEDGSGALLLLRLATADSLGALLAADPFALAGLLAGVDATAWKPVIGLLSDHA